MCQPRSVEALQAAVDLVDPEHNPDLLPRDITGDGKNETFCNFFIAYITRLLGCSVPQMLANDQVEWLRDNGSQKGWYKVTPSEALEAANAGKPTIVGWHNKRGHGHIALVRETPKGKQGIWIAQAGVRNYAHAPIVKGFGIAAPLEFFSHA